MWHMHTDKTDNRQNDGVSAMSKRAWAGKSISKGGRETHDVLQKAEIGGQQSAAAVENPGLVDLDIDAL